MASTRTRALGKRSIRPSSFSSAWSGPYPPTPRIRHRHAEDTLERRRKGLVLRHLGAFRVGVARDHDRGVARRGGVVNAKPILIVGVDDLDVGAVGRAARGPGGIVPAERAAGGCVAKPFELVRAEAREDRFAVIEQLRHEPRRRKAEHLEECHRDREHDQPKERFAWRARAASRCNSCSSALSHCHFILKRPRGRPARAQICGSGR